MSFSGENNSGYTAEMTGESRWWLKKVASFFSGKRGNTISCRPGDTNPSDATGCLYKLVALSAVSSSPGLNLALLRTHSTRSIVFAALHGMQTRSSNENSVCLSVCPSACLSACQTRALWQNRRKVSPDFYTMRKIILVFWEEEWLVGATLLPEILGHPAPVGAKSSILNQ